MQTSPFSLALDSSWTIGSYIYASLVCLGPKEQSLAQGELLGLSLILDDVLQASDLAKTSPFLQNGISSDHSNIRFPSSTLQTPNVIGKSISRQASNQSTPRGLSDPSKIGPRSSLPAPCSNTLSSLCLLVPPLEGTQLMKQFLIKSSQLEVLKEEWGKKMLRLHSVVTREHAELLESAYRDKVMNWVKKMVAKQQMRDLARIQAESVSFLSRH